jgi:hypothetical protein
MMQDNTPINFYIKHFFINCQIKKLQPIFDTFVPPCIPSFHFFHLLKNTNFTMYFKHSQRPSILADANSINQSLDNQLAFFTHLRIVFNLNLVNIKRLPPLIYHFNFSELFFTLFKKKTCENGTTYTSRSTNK